MGNLPQQTRRQPGVAVKPQTIRKARLRAGMTLAQLAEGHVTKAAIHLMEHGRIRPSMATLLVIARKTGRPLSYFLEEADETGQPLDLTALQVLAHQGRHQDLVAEAERLFPMATSATAVASLRYFLGVGHAALGQPTRALDELRAARDEFEHRGDGWMAVDCMEWEAAALELAGHPRASEVARLALERCRALDPVPRTTEVRLLVRLGGISAAARDWPEALRWYEQASATAGALGDLERLAQMHGDMSRAYQELGDRVRAEAYAQRVLTIHEILRDRQSAVRAEHNVGRILMQRGDLDAAGEYLERALALGTVPLDQARLDPMLSLARLALARDDLPAARTRADEALALAEKLGDRPGEGVARQLRGLVAHRAGDVEGARRELEAALTLLEGLGKPRLEVDCRRAYAAVLEAQGEGPAAIDQLHRALALATDDPGSAEW